MSDDVNQILNHFKPFFHAHGGDFEVEGMTEDGKVRVRLSGECVLCELKDRTAEGMTMALRNAMPGFEGIEIAED